MTVARRGCYPITANIRTWIYHLSSRIIWYFDSLLLKSQITLITSTHKLVLIENNCISNVCIYVYQSHKFVNSFWISNEHCFEAKKNKCGKEKIDIISYKFVIEKNVFAVLFGVSYINCHEWQKRKNSHHSVDRCIL